MIVLKLRLGVSIPSPETEGQNQSVCVCVWGGVNEEDTVWHKYNTSNVFISWF